ncbi:anthranilate synthase component II [Listeria costaricensis]|uniref:anthranilate synthase component II n=1 Tax=Listeria costaricensis TaxID=2026604 RepID=UPI000C07BE10|nr:aminodeoxychorismate/anthranilate synthase component II [Listeria costaricensis]
MLLLIDHHDSFTYNLYQYFLTLGEDCEIVTPDKLVALQSVENYSGIVLSPGPGSPADAHETLAFLAKYATKRPILGICLGHQLIAHFFGADILHGAAPVHGKNSLISADTSSRLFQKLPAEFSVTRYHSLIVSRETLPNCLTVTAETKADQVVMGLEHTELPIMSVQFHPEAVLSENGHALLANFIACLATDRVVTAR